jgi:predicted aspartyl protease
MGVVFANIRLSNPVKPDLLPIDTKCLVDSGSTYLCIPQHLAIQLGLSELQKREIILGDETAKLVHR